MIFALCVEKYSCPVSSVKIFFFFSCQSFAQQKHIRHVKALELQDVSSNRNCLSLKASKTVESATGQAMETEAAE